MEQDEFSYFTMESFVGSVERFDSEKKRFILFLLRKVSRVVELEASHWHPPSLPPHRTQSLRHSSGKKPGGQACHVGYRLDHCEDPGTVVHHVVGVCRPHFPDLEVYLMNGQFIPVQCTDEFFQEVFDQPIPGGTLNSLQDRASEILEATEMSIHEALVKSSEVHFDESGMRCEKKGYWLHQASTELLIYYGNSEKAKNRQETGSRC